MIEEKKIQEETNIIRKITKTDVANLVDSGFNFGINELRQPLINKISQNLGLSPKKTQLVIYSVKAKLAIGFLSLIKDSKSIQSIRYLYTIPKFRRRGIATKLVSTAIFIARENGATKLFLTSNPEEGIIKLYRKLGFVKIDNSLTVWGRGKTLKMSNSAENKLTLLDTKSTKGKEFLFRIYKQCVGENWLTFFEDGLNDVFYGYPQDFKKLFFRDTYVNEYFDSFVIIFRRPMQHTVNAYIYLSSGSQVKPIFKGLMNLFVQKGIIYSRITVFNITNNDCHDLFKKINFHHVTTIFMGKHLASYSAF